jgi:hypothetical protein
MKCPHCLVTIHPAPKRVYLGQFREGHWIAETVGCPACGSPIVKLGYGGGWTGGDLLIQQVHSSFLAHPRSSGRAPIPPEVDDKDVIADYSEACAVLPISPKASAALSRRCLQHILRTKTRAKPGNLNDEIQEAIDKQLLPSHLLESIDAVRQIGNFAAHPIKSTSSGEILPVEPGEAEWNLDVLEGMFDFHFVQPALTAKKRAQLNLKLQEAGKPPLK